jgi:hypothetical protein
MSQWPSSPAKAAVPREEEQPHPIAAESSSPRQGDRLTGGLASGPVTVDETNETLGNITNLCSEDHEMRRAQMNANMSVELDSIGQLEPRQELSPIAERVAVSGRRRRLPPKSAGRSLAASKDETSLAAVTGVVISFDVSASGAL